MAQVGLSNLSSNWKKLQASLQASKAVTPPKKTNASEKQDSLKRKRQSNGTAHSDTTQAIDHTPKKSLRKPPPSRKRQKMDEPSSIGASIKQHDTKNLSRSVSMPSLKKTSVLNSKSTADKSTILEPHPDFPDIENEGVSETALPGKYVALDCEMVGVGPEPNRDSALARVSLVNFHGHQVYDSYVQVPRKIEITDYRTAVSGIEPRHLRPDVARPFEEVREDLKVLLGGRILVGHAVKNDLDVLILKHDRRFIRDTSKFTRFRALAPVTGRTPGLKFLADKLLGIQIQTGAHSSVEDARATMALYRLEKDEFENEIRQKYGNVKLDLPRAETETGGDLAKKRNRSKKKKKGKH